MAFAISIIAHICVASILYSKYNDKISHYQLRDNMSTRYFQSIGIPKTLDEQMAFEYIIYGDTENMGTSFEEFKSNYLNQ